MNKTGLLPKAVFVALLSFTWGLYSHEQNLWPVESLRNLLHAVQAISASFDQYGRLGRLSAKIEMPCPGQDNGTAVLLLIGQSNAANHSNFKSASNFRHRVFNYFDGHCYVASSPLLGATGERGEGWTPLADMLVSQGIFEKVILIPAGIGGSAVSRWQKGGDLNRMLLDVIDQAARQYRITHVLWHQGESDYAAATSSEDYRSMFLSLVDSLRDAGVAAPVYVAVATRCGPASGDPSDNPVAAAQKGLPDASRGIFPGPDTDSAILDIDRYDGCHLAITGIAKFAAGWLEAIRFSDRSLAMAAKRGSGRATTARPKGLGPGHE